MGKSLQYINYYFQGEPFIHPNFLELVKEARKRKIYVLTSTNAHFISPKTAADIIESGLSELVISIDGTNQETYENYRVEGELAKVLDGTKNIIEARKKAGTSYPIITFQFLVSKQNEHQINEIEALKREYEVDFLNYKTIQVYDFESGNELIPTNPKYSRYKKTEEGGFVLKNKFKNSCWRMWSSCVFTWDGTVVPCCFDKDATHNMGNIDNTEFGEIWKSGIYSEFRSKISKNRKQIEICKNCSEGSKIWI
jgi:radical SAM protein with 4Fe4S-binding SPASM domain